MIFTQIASFFFAPLFSFLITLYLIPLCITIAHKYQLVDTPDGTIKKHEKPVAYLGGVALYAGFLCTLAFVFPFENHFCTLLIGSTLLLFVGLLDDLYPLGPVAKIIGQGIAIICFLRAGFYLKEQFFMVNMWGLPLSALWIISIINAFNLLDVADGLAIMTSLCATCLFILFAFLTHNALVVLLLFCLIGAQAAFLYYNKPPARIYLGDAGSLFLGGIMAVIPFCISWGTFTSSGWLIPPVILAIACFEIASLIILRTYYNLPFWLASSHHVAHRLAKRNQSRYILLVGIVFFGLIQVILSYLLFYGLIGPLLFFGCMTAFFCFWVAI
jgi:UDP-GlcNAc:undecaprenyl-phosphate GlcNAc-1-phosphate transferase